MFDKTSLLKEGKKTKANVNSTRGKVFPYQYNV